MADAESSKYLQLNPTLRRIGQPGAFMLGEKGDDLHGAEVWCVLGASRLCPTSISRPTMLTSSFSRKTNEYRSIERPAEMNQDRDHILAQLRRLAESNGGEPVGERTFLADTRLTRRCLQIAGFPNYGAAVEAAGFARKTLQQAFTDDQLFQPLAQLTRERGRFPTTNERQVQRYKDSAFPGYDAYSRRANN
jgi:hypothetical protein